MNGKQLVQQYLRSRTQSAWHKVGRIDVNIEGGMTRMPVVHVNWPGIGAQFPADALEFAAELTAACLLGVQAESILADWDGVDQWLEPGLRSEDEYEQAIRDL